ncbi:hypothetical protein B0H13DRAFT_1551081, partial [Mycena leptocephala]
VKLGSVNGGLTKADLSTRLFQMGLFMAHANESRHAAEQNNIENIAQPLDDLRIRLDDGYTFTRDQMVRVLSQKSIRAQAQDIIYEPTCTSFTKMHLDQKLRDNKGTAKLTSVFGNPAREKILFPLVKRICSSVRHSFRQDIRNSICGDCPAMFADFTYISAMKFKRGGPGISLDVGYRQETSTAPSWYRRFARENPTVIGVEEVEGEVEDSRSSPAPATKKRKLSTQTQGGGRIPKGKDFWSQVDTFFTKKITEFGTKNLQNAGWKEYV